MYCKTCGSKLQDNANFCMNCGTPLGSNSGVPAYYAKSRLAYILLGIFLGGFGVHNFYADRISVGIAQLLLTVLLFWTIAAPLAVFVWVIVEICTVTVDGKGRPFTS
jgi:TM2 domain-containing membrane protein YozV